MPISDVNNAGLQMIRADHAVEIAELCNLAGRPDQIANFFAMRLTPDEAKNWLAAPPTPPPAVRPAGSIFGPGPTPQQRDALAVAIEARFRAQNKRAG